MVGRYEATHGWRKGWSGPDCCCWRVCDGLVLEGLRCDADVMGKSKQFKNIFLGCMK